MTDHISPSAKIGTNVSIGKHTIIGDNVIIEDDVTLGNFCILKSNVRIGKSTVIKNYVELREGTIIGEGCMVDSRVSSSGNCEIGNRVVLRYDVIIAIGTRIEDDTYISPRVMTNNLNSAHIQIGGPHIGKNCFIGTNAVIQHGVKIADHVVVGSMAFVNKDCIEKGTYLGIPAKKK